MVNNNAQKTLFGIILNKGRAALILPHDKEDSFISVFRYIRLFFPGVFSALGRCIAFHTYNDEHVCRYAALHRAGICEY